MVTPKAFFRVLSAAPSATIASLAITGAAKAAPRGQDGSLFSRGRQDLPHAGGGIPEAGYVSGVRGRP
jgi:hypothetical protein